MKLLGIILGLGLAFYSNIGYSNGVWVPHQPAVVLSPPVVVTPIVPSVTYSTYDFPRPSVLMYDWVPYVVNHLVVRERQGLFCRHRTYYYEPRTEWIYQPVWKSATY